MLDFRGRMYPIPVDFQPQGRDLARGLLTFDEGKPLGENGGWWLAVHLANTFGHDKIGFDERVAWASEREELWRNIAKDPLKHREWAEADSPWQALAAVFEFVGALEEGDGFVSHLPIRVDGTCNGLQHLSAMVRDPIGGAATNLVPADTPQDIYKRVAVDRLTAKLWEIEASGGEEGRKAKWWLDLCGGELPRSLTKRPVMILPYGGSRDAFFRYTNEWLDEYHPGVRKTARYKHKGKQDKRDFADGARLSGFLVKHMWEAVQEQLPKAMEVMEWLRKCGKLAARGDQPVFWMTPDGFVVRHFCGKLKRRSVTTRIDGQRHVLTEWIVTSELDLQAQLKGIPPNFTHSMDAAACRIAIAKVRNEGVRSITAIHDAFGALAADMWTLHWRLREAFIEVHQCDVLEGFREACQTVLADHIVFTERTDEAAAMKRADAILPEVPERGDLDLGKIIESDYFFA
jgi:DNA-directed RNA polymerase